MQASLSRHLEAAPMTQAAARHPTASTEGAA